MDIVPLEIAGAFKVILDTHRDQRGFFARTYDCDVFKKQGLATQWVQESHSFSAKKGTVRGLHFQRPPHAETKLIYAVCGRIFIVMLDLRKGSSTFSRQDTFILSSETPELLYVPKGLALGMCTLTDNCSLFYKMDMEFHPESARTVKWDDPALGIDWPAGISPVVSEKDAKAAALKELLALEGPLVL